MKRKIVTMIILCALAVSMVSGCGKKEEEPKPKTQKEEAEKEPEEPEEPEVELKEIGTKSEKAFEVKLTNKTGQDVMAISVKTTDEAEYPANMLAESDVFVKDETRVLYYEPAEKAEEQETEAETEDEKEISVGYSIQLTLADSNVVELHSFPFEDIEEGTINLQDMVAYITYSSVASESEVSTLEAELATKAAAEAEAAAQAQAEAEAAAQAQAEAEAAARAQAEAEAAAAAAAQAAAQQQQQQTYSQPAQQPAQTWAPPSGGSGGGDDGCVGDGLTY